MHELVSGQSYQQHEYFMNETILKFTRFVYYFVSFSYDLRIAQITSKCLCAVWWSRVVTQTQSHSATIYLFHAPAYALIISFPHIHLLCIFFTFILAYLQFTILSTQSHTHTHTHAPTHPRICLLRSCMVYNPMERDIMHIKSLPIFKPKQLQFFCAYLFIFCCCCGVSATNNFQHKTHVKRNTIFFCSFTFCSFTKQTRRRKTTHCLKIWSE